MSRSNCSGCSAEHGVAFVAIGGFTAEVQGVSWSTLDLDIVIEKREENYTALAAALVDYATLAPDALETNLGGDTFLVAGLSAILLRHLEPLTEDEHPRVRPHWSRIQQCEAWANTVI